ncbi:glutaredoxin family protein [Gordonia sp. L191]|uniref:glutaredoxin family protein n=1 Tax=Gordonia sp. L191 TaxID=2982699 RepID=UPI0024C0C409|nr:glutaredoxin family protein [Gordonia sp. L191]WHU46003.1 glutaredoxin family protein [Gordonia sp. L191]
MTITLLSRDGCAACARAADDLARICAEEGADLEIVDVDAAAADGDVELRAEFGDRLPVILLDGEEHGYWEVDEPRLRADLARR